MHVFLTADREAYLDVIVLLGAVFIKQAAGS